MTALGGVLSRSCAKHTTLLASLPGLSCASRNFLITARGAAGDAARGAARRTAGGSGAAGLHACVVERAAQRLLRATRLPGRQRARAGGDGASVPAPGGRALRRGQAHEDPRTGGLRPVLPRGPRAAC